MTKLEAKLILLLKPYYSYVLITYVVLNPEHYGYGRADWGKQIYQRALEITQGKD